MDELCEAWLDYYMACEAYDRTVCTGPIGRDGIQPATAREFGLINQNARREMAEMRRRYPHATDEQWRSAKFKVLDGVNLLAEFEARRNPAATGRSESK